MSILDEDPFVDYSLFHRAVVEWAKALNAFEAIQTKLDLWFLCHASTSNVDIGQGDRLIAEGMLIKLRMQRANEELETALLRGIQSSSCSPIKLEPLLGTREYIDKYHLLKALQAGNSPPPARLVDDHYDLFTDQYGDHEPREKSTNDSAGTFWLHWRRPRVWKLSGCPLHRQHHLQVT